MASIKNNSTTNNLININNIIESTCINANRPIGTVKLLAVSKTRSAEQVGELFHQGQIDFGENYLQEALDKQSELADLAITWHFIGPIQSNKTKLIAQNFQWVHSIDRIKIATRLNEHYANASNPLNICIQVNISNEDSKAGCLPEECIPLMEQIAKLPHLKIRGLMAIPKASQNIEEQTYAFAALKRLFEQCKTQFPTLELDTLSMGMSADIVPAIEQGSTIVRVGTALFGPRDYS